MWDSWCDWWARLFIPASWGHPSRCVGHMADWPRWSHMAVGPGCLIRGRGANPCEALATGPGPCHAPRTHTCHCSLHTWPLNHHLPLHLTLTKPPSFDTMSSRYALVHANSSLKNVPMARLYRYLSNKLAPNLAVLFWSLMIFLYQTHHSYLKVASTSFTKTNIDNTSSDTNIENPPVPSPPSPNHPRLEPINNYLCSNKWRRCRKTKMFLSQHVHSGVLIFVGSI
jgi:hypothetical protein